MIENQLDETVLDDIRNTKSLDDVLSEIAEECIACKICVKQCSFLKKYGTPKKIAESCIAQKNDMLVKAFECSLCSLCTAVCPVKIDPRHMFLEMRRYAAAKHIVDFHQQKLLINFEKRSASQLYSFYGLPAGCDTVFFPGCALAGTRQHRVVQLYDHLLKFFPNLGIVLDCCTKPSHDLGRSAYFHAMFSDMQQYLAEHGVKNILVACPSCYSIFSEYSSRLATRSVYDVMAKEHWQHAAKIPAGPVTVQDSCVARFETGMQNSVRRLIQARGVSFEEMKHHGKKTLCCGEGGGAHFVAPELAGNWVTMRRNEVESRRIITYCAGCANFLGKMAPTAHLLDLLFDPGATLAGRAKVAKPPFTYLNRILLKWKFRRKRQYAFSRERTGTLSAI